MWSAISRCEAWRRSGSLSSSRMKPMWAPELGLVMALRALPGVPTFDSTSSPAASTADHGDRLPEYLQREAREEIEALARTSPRAMVAPPIIQVGPPAKTVLAAAAEAGADLIVIGCHGLHGLDHILRTTTGAVAARAPCNVLVVHGG